MESAETITASVEAMARVAATTMATANHVSTARAADMASARAMVNEEATVKVVATAMATADHVSTAKDVRTVRAASAEATVKVAATATATASHASTARAAATTMATVSLSELRDRDSRARVLEDLTEAAMKASTA